MAPDVPDVQHQPGGPHPDDPPRTAVRVHAELTQQPLRPADLLARVADPTAGGVSLFVGTVRDHHEGVAVTGLTYEIWEERSSAALRRVADEVAEAHPTVRAVAVVHRHGRLEVGEHAIVAAASAPHRVPAQAAVADLVERVKAEVPIWKREELADGDHRWPGTDTSPDSGRGASGPSGGPGSVPVRPPDTSGR